MELTAGLEDPDISDVDPVPPHSTSM
jgi:hypothetical protein